MGLRWRRFAHMMPVRLHLNAAAAGWFRSGSNSSCPLLPAGPNDRARGVANPIAVCCRAVLFFRPVCLRSKRNQPAAAGFNCSRTGKRTNGRWVFGFLFSSLLFFSNFSKGFLRILFTVLYEANGFDDTDSISVVRGLCMLFSCL